MDIDKQIQEVLTSSIREAARKNLEGFNSPLEPIIKRVVAKKELEIEKLLEESLSFCFQGDFREDIKLAATHKLAKVLISKMESEIDKKANELRTNPTFRAKLTLAIEDIVNNIKTS